MLRSTRSIATMMLFASTAIAAAPAAAQSATGASTGQPPEQASTAANETTEQDNPADIVVTAQRRAERLQDVPLSVSAISGEALQNAQITSADRLEQVLPGVRMGRSGSDLRPAIRGTYTEIISANADPRIGIYVDDIYQSRTSQVPPIIDLERVELQKGPQGTLYGRNSFGGNIAFFSALPKDRFEAGIDVTVGRFEQFRTEAFVNLPLSDGIGLRVAGLRDKMDGYIRNLAPNSSRYGGKDDWFVRGTLRIAPPSWNDRVELLLRGSYQSYGGTGLGGFWYKILGTPVDPSLITAPGGSITRNGVTYSLPNGFNGATFSGSVLVPVDARFKDGIADLNGADIGIRQPTDPYTVNAAGRIFNDGHQGQFSGVANVDLGPVRFRSITSYTDFDLTRTGGSVTPVLLNFSYLQTMTETFTQELQLLSNNDGPFRWIVGGYWFDDDIIELNVTNLNRSYVTASAPAGQQFFGWNFLFSTPGGSFNQATGYDSIANYNQKTKSIAGYGQASYTIGDALTLTAGLRYTKDDKKLYATAFNRAATGPGSFFAHSINDPQNFTCGGFVAANPASVSADPTAIQQAYRIICGDTEQDFWTYRLAADYKLSRNHMIYASYSTGAHSGGFNTGAVSGQLIPFEPEYVKAYEIGSKNSFLDGDLILNVAAFWNEYRDLQAQTSIPNPFNPAAVIALVQNIGKDRAYGLDVEGSWRPTDPLTITFGLNWMRARQIDYAVNTFNFGGNAAFCNITPSCILSTGESNGVQGTPFPNARTDPNRFIPVLDANGNPIVVGGVPQLRYVIAGRGRDGTRYTSRKAFQPDFTAQLGAGYEIELGSSGSLTPEVQFYYNGGYILTDLTPNFGNQEAYTKTDLRLTWRSADDRFRVQAFVNNVEDEAVITRAVYASNRTLVASFALPRTYGISFGARF